MTTDVTVTEVLLRDGLQDHAKTIPTQVKLKLATMLRAAGLTELEIGLFVPAAVIPQMADSADVLAGLPDDGARYVVLAPNAVGVQRSLDAGARDIRLFLSASEGHSRSNTRRGRDGGLAAVVEMAGALAARPDVRVSVAVAVAFVCPYDGPTDPADVVRIARAAHDAGVRELVVADTIGKATPDQVRRTVGAVLEACPDLVLGCHLHDAFDTATANTRAALAEGVRRFDGSLGGLGGCPFAPGAPGNHATEKLVALLEHDGYHTGVDLDALRAAAVELPGLVS